METLNYDWLAFSVDLGLLRAWIDTNMASATCVGISANSQMELHFDARPSDADIEAFETYYNGLTETDTEATTYFSQVDIQIAHDTLKANLDPTKSWDALTIPERKLILGQELTLDDLGLTGI